MKKFVNFIIVSLICLLFSGCAASMASQKSHEDIGLNKGQKVIYEMVKSEAYKEVAKIPAKSHGPITSVKLKPVPTPLAKNNTLELEDYKIVLGEEMIVFLDRHIKLHQLGKIYLIKIVEYGGRADDAELMAQYFKTAGINVKVEPGEGPPGKITLFFE